MYNALKSNKETESLKEHQVEQTKNKLGRRARENVKNAAWRTVRHMFEKTLPSSLPHEKMMHA